MARMPGAIWTPKNVAGRSARRKGRCVVFHVAVSEAQNLMPGPDADWHFYVAKDGRIYQYIDTDLQAWATRDANPTAIAVETQGGVNDAQGEPWTAAQVASLSGIARWANQSEGVPLRLMQSSRPEERGLGWHRLGIDPWRVSGGELWSGARGKVCPGDAKIAQMPEILRLALAGPVEDDLPYDPDDIRGFVASAPIPKSAGGVGPADLDSFLQFIADRSASAARSAAQAVALIQQSSGAKVDEKALAAALVPLLSPVLQDKFGASKQDVEDALREVLGGLDSAA